MFSDNCKINFEGFEPSANVLDMLEQMLDRTLEAAPSDAFLRAIFVFDGRNFEGVLKVASSCGTFVTEARGGSPVDVISRLTFGINKQIRRWKKQRFRHMGAPLNSGNSSSDFEFIAG